MSSTAFADLYTSHDGFSRFFFSFVVGGLDGTVASELEDSRGTRLSKTDLKHLYFFQNLHMLHWLFSITPTAAFVEGIKLVHAFLPFVSNAMNLAYVEIVQ